MLPKKHRLTDDYDFRKVRRRGRILKSPFFTLGWLMKKDYLLASAEKLRWGDSTRFGFVISTKIDKRAVERNRVKRIFREAVRVVLPQVKDGFDVVFWVKRKALEADSKKVQKAVERALGKAGILRN